MKNLTRTSHAKPSPRAGFTLIELMITIVIIGVLMAIILPSISAVRTRVKLAAVKNEIEALDRAITDFKGVYGIEPPSSILIYENPSGWNTNNADTKRSRAAIKQMWPQFDFSIARDINGDGDSNDTITLTGAECLVFFLGGIRDNNKAFIGFSKNPANPFTRNASGNRNGPFHEFQQSRIVDLDNDQMSEYLDSLTGQTAPLLYLSGYEGQGYRTTDLVVGSSNDLENYYREGSDTGPAWKLKSFQIISPGLDGEYGVGGKYDPATAKSDLTGNRSVEKDNITNFIGGTRMAD